jgi:hypothetical protein
MCRTSRSDYYKETETYAGLEFLPLILRSVQSILLFGWCQLSFLEKINAVATAETEMIEA